MSDLSKSKQMKQILAATDFSPASFNAAKYALQLASQLELRLTFAAIIPLAIPNLTPVGIDSPPDPYRNQLEDAAERLKQLTARLGAREDENGETSAAWPAELKVISGNAETEIKTLMKTGHYAFAVLGLSDKSRLSRFILGSTSAALVKAGVGPLLLIPKHTAFRPLRQIFFATDLSESDIGGLKLLYNISSLARADLHIIHVVETIEQENNEAERIKNFRQQVSRELCSSSIHFQNIYSKNFQEGLGWLNGHMYPDLLSVIHRKYPLLKAMLFTGHSQRIANSTQIPLLVIPAEEPLTNS